MASSNVSGKKAGSNNAGVDSFVNEAKDLKLG